MFRQIRYFQAVVRTGSFSEAADECSISQSAVSQQIQALERELGFQLLERKKRKAVPTPAGEYFYRKSLILLSDYERICSESRRIADHEEGTLRLGFLRSYAGSEFSDALTEFSRQYPDVPVDIFYGNHEELFQRLRNEEIDLVLNDQRRAFSDEYHNEILISGPEYIGISKDSMLCALPSITAEDLKNIPCILISSETQEETETVYSREVIGLNCDFLFARDMKEARLKVIGRQGFLLAEGISPEEENDSQIAYLPLMRNGKQSRRNYCAFWKKDNSGFYIETFADLLKSCFERRTGCPVSEEV